MPCPDGDFILVIARALPAFVLTLVDTGIFYTARSRLHEYIAHHDLALGPHAGMYSFGLNLHTNALCCSF